MEKADLQWRQRAKMEWLRGGDSNARFFLSCATSRRQSNKTLSISDVGSEQRTTEDEVNVAFVNYFTELFTARPAGNMALCISPVGRKVTNEMNTALLKPFTTKEVHFALFQMAPLKAPGSDGFSTSFYQKSWDIVGEDLCHAIIGTLNSGLMLSFLNMTNIALIPKVKNPSCVTDFRSISLYNVPYKLISKVLANKLKKILASIISPVRSAFILDILIIDNVLVTYETLHTMHTRMRGKKGFIAVKLDMSKADELVE
jgi:hypothetical protein